jgi:EAL domain-containing protein (putative c-di-GMP-specific phosphodiesterase class I)
METEEIINRVIKLNVDVIQGKLLSECERISDAGKLIQSHVAIISNYRGKTAAKPYEDRLVKLIKLHDSIMGVQITDTY